MGNMKTSARMSIRSERTMALILSGALCLCVSLAHAQAGRPDFTGAWGNFSTERIDRASALPPGEMRLNVAGRSARQDFLSVTEGTNHGAGNACLGSGTPESTLRSGIYPMEVIQRPEQLLLIFESRNEIRRIYIGDAARDPEAFFPERNGYSTAHWEGDRLVVMTTRLKTQVDSRYPHTSDATIREVFYLDDPLEDGTRVLVDELTLTDPTWLETPFKTTKRWQELPDYHVLSYECNEPEWLDEMKMLYDAAGLEMVQE